MATRFDIEVQGIENFDRFLAAYPRESANAGRRAINKTLAWVNTHGTRAIAHAHGIPLKALRRRRRVAVRQSVRANLVGRIWFGLLPLPASAIGKPRSTKGGARVGKFHFPGAFVAEMPNTSSAASARFGIAGQDPGGHVGAFRRKSELTRRTFGRPETSPPNLPIEEVKVRLEAADKTLRQVFARAPGRMRDVFLQEFRFELLKRTGQVGARRGRR